MIHITPPGDRRGVFVFPGRKIGSFTQIRKLALICIGYHATI